MKKRNIISTIEIVAVVVILVASAPLLKARLAFFLNNKGVDYYRQGDCEKAFSLLKMSIKIKPITQAHCNLAKLYGEIDKIPESIAEYEKALILDAHCVDAYYGLAHNYHKRDMYPQAISYLEEVQPLDPYRAQEELEQLRNEYTLCLFNQAADLYLANQQNQAEVKLKELIEFAPAFAHTYKVLGDINFKRGLFYEAIANYKQAVEFGLNDVNIYNLFNDIGISYVRLEDYDNAIKYLHKAHKLDPSSFNILYSLASTLRDRGDLTGALKKYQQLSKLNFNYPNLHNDLGELYTVLGDKEQAKKEHEIEIEIAEQELAKNPQDSAFMRYRLALAYNGLQEYEKAKEIIDLVIQENPEYAEALYARAKIHEGMQEIKKAIADAEGAKKLFPSAEFIDYHILRLKTKSDIPREDAFFLADTVIYLKNGRQITGRLKENTGQRIFLEVLVGDSFGTIAINLEDIEKIEEN